MYVFKKGDKMDHYCYNCKKLVTIVEDYGNYPFRIGRKNIIIPDILHSACPLCKKPLLISSTGSAKLFVYLRTNNLLPNKYANKLTKEVKINIPKSLEDIVYCIAGKCNASFDETVGILVKYYDRNKKFEDIEPFKTKKQKVSIKVTVRFDIYEKLKKASSYLDMKLEKYLESLLYRASNDLWVNYWVASPYSREKDKDYKNKIKAKSNIEAKIFYSYAKMFDRR